MGERNRKLKEVVVAIKLATAGSRFQVKWAAKSNATAMGQLAFFAEFLEVVGVF